MEYFPGMSKSLGFILNTEKGKKKKKTQGKFPLDLT